ncbi:hypothetical protein V9K67_17150 [Paraflavisolibacter sp. H34]|uniref:hypothetical protein n=1 Tax=Huijunlia imazamoxiresistens TaxID=3127457 RepID=UPI00301AEF87
MAEITRKNQDRGGGNPGNLTGQGSGQQTSGQRGEKLVKKEDTPGYGSNAPKKEKGTHGGNR